MLGYYVSTKAVFYVVAVCAVLATSILPWLPEVDDDAARSGINMNNITEEQKQDIIADRTSGNRYINDSGDSAQANLCFIFLDIDTILFLVGIFLFHLSNAGQLVIKSKDFL